MSFSYNNNDYSLTLDISGLNTSQINIVTLSSNLYSYPLTISNQISLPSYNYLTISSYTISSVVYSSSFTNANYNFFNMTISNIFAFNFLSLSNYIAPTITTQTISNYIVNTSLYVDTDTNLALINSNINYLNSYFSNTTISNSISGIIYYTNYQSSFNTLSGYVYSLLNNNINNTLYLSSLSSYISNLVYVDQYTRDFNKSLSGVVYSNYNYYGNQNNIITNINNYQNIYLLSLSASINNLNSGMIDQYTRNYSISLSSTINSNFYSQNALINLKAPLTNPIINGLLTTSNIIINGDMILNGRYTNTVNSYGKTYNFSNGSFNQIRGITDNNEISFINTVSANDTTTSFKFHNCISGKLFSDSRSFIFEIRPDTSTLNSSLFILNEGTLYCGGLASFARNVNIGAKLAITLSTASTDINTGALVVSGGVGVAGKINCGFLNTAGQVGVNTSTPTSGYQLDVNGSTRVNVDLLVNGSTRVNADLLVNGTTTVTGSTYTPAIICTNIAANKRIVIYDEATSETADNATSFYGFGLNPYMLRYQTSSTTNTHSFFTGSSLRFSIGQTIISQVPININSQLAVNTLSPTSGYQMDVNGGALMRGNVIIMGQAGINTSSPTAGYYLDINGNTRTSDLNITNTLTCGYRIPNFTYTQVVGTNSTYTFTSALLNYNPARPYTYKILFCTGGAAFPYCDITGQGITGSASNNYGHALKWTAANTFVINTGVSGVADYYNTNLLVIATTGTYLIYIYS